MKKLFLFLICLLGGFILYTSASPPTNNNNNVLKQNRSSFVNVNIAISDFAKRLDNSSLNLMETIKYIGADENVYGNSFNSFFSISLNCSNQPSNQLSCVQTRNIWTLTPNGNGGSVLQNLKYPINNTVKISEENRVHKLC